MGALASKRRRATREQREEQRGSGPENEIKTKEDSLKILVLGTLGSGKSTICKQMKILDIASEESRGGYKEVIRSNISESIRSLLKAMKTFGVHFNDAERLQDEKQFKELLHDFDFRYVSPETWDSLERLWKDSAVQECMARSDEFQLDVNAEYFLNNIDRIRKENYIPTTQDILRTRMKTTGILAQEITMNDMKFTLFDVGGARAERKKWLHASDNLTATMYLVGIADYYKVLAEDEETNRLNESLKLWESFLNAPPLKEIPLVLVLNQQDLLEEKLEKFPFKKYHPNYEGENTFSDVADYIKDLFLDIAMKRERNVPVYFTSALDTDEIHSLFESIFDVLELRK